jgi:hypothetical protein
MQEGQDARTKKNEPPRESFAYGKAGTKAL